MKSFMISDPSSEIPLMAAHACALRGLADNLEDAVEPLNLAFSLAFMFDEGGPEFLGLRRFRHLRQGLQDLVLGKVDVFECFMKEIFELFWFFRPDDSR